MSVPNIIKAGDGQAFRPSLLLNLGEELARRCRIGCRRRCQGQPASKSRYRAKIPSRTLPQPTHTLRCEAAHQRPAQPQYPRYSNLGTAMTQGEASGTPPRLFTGLRRRRWRWTACSISKPIVFLCYSLTSTLKAILEICRICNRKPTELRYLFVDLFRIRFR